ncbi:MAG: 50S ribosomal protein L11 methyltransferase [Christensenellales bacterium]
MDWIEVAISTNREGADLLSEYLQRFGVKGTQIIDRADVPDPRKPSGYWELIDQSLIDAMPTDVIVKAWFEQDTDLAPLREGLSQLPALAGFDLGPLELTLSTVREKDWAEYWKRFYKPFRLGRRLVVRPTWESYQPAPDDLVIDLDPGLAFGTGTHETTALCVELIERYYRSGPLLDVGTGSGILAIAAAKLGAQSVLAIDIDPLAVRTARENVAINGLQDAVTVRQGDLLRGVSGRFDFAAANILADVIILLCGPLKQRLNPGAVFVCSGIILEREADVREALLAAGYEPLTELHRGEWVALAVRA